MGYAGGTLVDPTYHRLGDHTEALQLDFDPHAVSYEELLAMFWASHAPGRGSHSRQYMAAVFCETAVQLEQASASRARIAARSGLTVETPVTAGARFYRAEDYHQKYHLRRYRDLVGELAAYSPTQLVDSTVAARLNGYVAGRGTLERLHEELASFGLSASANTQLEKLVRGRA